MNIDHPVPGQLPQLKALWQQAFGDSDAEIEAFFKTGFSRKRCLCVTCGEDVAAALYWFDCAIEGRKIAYLYAIATEQGYRRQGIAGKLILFTHRRLKAEGYQGAVLVPSEEGLFGFYQQFGYAAFGGIAEFTCSAADSATSLSKIDKDAYAVLRKTYLPQGSVFQEDALLACLDSFYQGDDFICVALERNGELFVPELLGNAEKAPQILKALGFSQGLFRAPGSPRRFAMLCPFGSLPAPTYFGLALD